MRRSTRTDFARRASFSNFPHVRMTGGMSSPDLAVSAIGVPDPGGEIVVACVVLEDGAGADDARLDAHCLASIVRFKRPKCYAFHQAVVPPRRRGIQYSAAFVRTETAAFTGSSAFADDDG
jgi:hypothetical protein